MEVTFTVPAVPVAQPRQRHRIVGKGDRQFVQNYTPTGDKVNTFKATARMSARAAYGGSPVECPLRVDATFVFPRTRAQTWKKKPMPRLPHAKKPDRDNLDKALMDALTGLLWIDDAQVCDGRIVKVIASGDEQPHVVVRVTEVTDAV